MMPRDLATSSAMASRNSGNAGRGAVVCRAVAHGIHAGFDDVAGRVLVGLTNLEMDDVLALALQGAGANQDFEGSFGTEPRHAVGQAQLGLCSSHSKPMIITPSRRCSLPPF